jgi:hypothetical protein
MQRGAKGQTQLRRASASPPRRSHLPTYRPFAPPEIPSPAPEDNPAGRGMRLPGIRLSGSPRFLPRENDRNRIRFIAAVTVDLDLILNIRNRNQQPHRFIRIRNLNCRLGQCQPSRVHEDLTVRLTWPLHALDRDRTASGLLDSDEQRVRTTVNHVGPGIPPLMTVHSPGCGSNYQTVGKSSRARGEQRHWLLLSVRFCTPERGGHGKATGKACRMMSGRPSSATYSYRKTIFPPSGTSRICAASSARHLRLSAELTSIRFSHEKSPPNTKGFLGISRFPAGSGPLMVCHSSARG